MAKDDVLVQVSQKVAKCKLCPLHKGATQAVPGDGSAKSGIVFIGEAPGTQEDKHGIPFCGPAGKLLEDMLKKIDLKRSDVYIGNVIKHRPPSNRDPEPAEIEACFPYLVEQLNALKPKLIVTLGRYAMNIFLPDYSISQVHGCPKRIDWERSPHFKKHLPMYSKKIVVLPLYHPAVGLYRGSMKEVMESDFKKIPDILEKINKK